VSNRDAAATRSHEIVIDNETCVIHTLKTGKVTWKAYGEFRGKHINEGGRSESGAIMGWRKIANYIANE
jgi:hypothetical protein